MRFRVGSFGFGVSSWEFRFGGFELGVSSWGFRVGGFELGELRVRAVPSSGPELIILINVYIAYGNICFKELFLT